MLAPGALARRFWGDASAHYLPPTSSRKHSLPNNIAGHELYDAQWRGRPHQTGSRYYAARMCYVLARLCLWATSQPLPPVPDAAHSGRSGLRDRKVPAYLYAQTVSRTRPPPTGLLAPRSPRHRRRNGFDGNVRRMLGNRSQPRPPPTTSSHVVAAQVDIESRS
jgi:hypothetical protein